MKELFGQGARAFLLSNGSFAINFAGNLALVRILTPQIFGTYALAVALVGIVEIFTTFALQTVYLQRRASERLLAAIVQAMIGIAGLKCLVVLLVLLVLQRHYDAEVWTIFGFIFAAKLLVPFNALLVAMLEKQFRFTASSFVTSLSNSASVVVAVGTGLLGGGILSLAVRDVLPILIMLGLGLWLNRSVKIRWRAFNLRQSRTLVRSALDMYAVRASELGFSKLPPLVVERLFGVEILGFLHQALYLVNSVNRVTVVLNQQIAVVYFNRYRKNRAKTAEGFRILLAISAALGILAAPILLFFPETLIRILWGEAWLGARDILRIMALLVFVIPLFTILKSQLYGRRRTLWLAGTYIFGALSILPLLLALRQAGLAPGVAVAVAYFSTFSIMALTAAWGVFTKGFGSPSTGGAPQDLPLMSEEGAP